MKAFLKKKKVWFIVLVVLGGLAWWKGPDAWRRYTNPGGPDQAYQELVSSHLTKLERLTAPDQERHRGVQQALEDSRAANGKGSMVNTITAYVELYESDRAQAAEAVQALGRALRANPVDQKEFNEMKQTLQALAALEFGQEKKLVSNCFRSTKRSSGTVQSSSLRVYDL